MFPVGYTYGTIELVNQLNISHLTTITIMKILVTILAFGLCVFINQKLAIAQATGCPTTNCPSRICNEDHCPTDAPPTNIGWTPCCKRYNHVEICPGIFCDLVICYCYRHTAEIPYDPTKGWDYTITQIIPLNCGNCTPTIQDLVNKAYDLLFTDNPAGFPCPQCTTGNSTVEWQESRAMCYKSVSSTYIDPSTGTPILIQSCVACESPGWCYKRYNVCCVNGVPTRTLIDTQTHGECETEGCTAIYCN
jgi:hypothetical protein